VECTTDNADNAFTPPVYEDQSEDVPTNWAKTCHLNYNLI